MGFNSGFKGLNSRIKLEGSEKDDISRGATNYLEPKLPVSEGL